MYSQIILSMMIKCPSLASQMAHTSHVSADQMSHECWSVTHVYMYQSDGVLMLAR